MKLPRLRSSVRKGFTLIELLTVIAIIGILAGMLSVVVPMVKKKAAQNDAMNNCRSIAIGYQSYASGGASPKNIPVSVTTVGDWAVYLAQKSELNEGRLWFIPADSALDALTTIPAQVIDPVAKTPNPDFVAAKPKSWAVVAGASRSADSTYPIVWTRGLSGTKWKDASPWGGQGGHIGFASGNVAWYTATDEEKGAFFDYASKKPTSDIQAAIGATAKIVEDSN